MRSPKALVRVIVRKARKHAALRRLGPRTSDWEVSVELVSSQAMAQLNRKYRGKRGATDVLSFPPPRIFRDTGYLGDLIVCESVLKKQAKQFNHSAQKELEVLVTHGILHLLGFDHEKGRKEAALMARWEDRLLSRSAGLIERGHSGNSR